MALLAEVVDGGMTLDVPSLLGASSFDWPVILALCDLGDAPGSGRVFPPLSGALEPGVSTANSDLLTCLTREEKLYSGKCSLPAAHALSAADWVANLVV